MLSDQKLLDAVCGPNLGNQLHDFGIPVSAVTANDQKAPLDAFGYGEEDAGDERFAVVRLLENDDLLP
jgi:hypothetical protein